ncbi:DUF4342 domain-containing protein [Thiohalocapsa marina]|uniref:DUF4342 domain-containing protein n=1 Tax=Thiohalocapsa marina TaxID=424902 RepID=A0A5M8FNB0_9GAMM|nr:DUF4342 domain-containing protein [Thiohalocapsa marina]KAA6186229.1 DUF4342 domain-containing protein [Thiohalocapsa marina]
MNPDQHSRTITERVTVAGGELVQFVKGLIADGSVRRLVIRRPNGAQLLDVPLTAGFAVGGVVTLFAPILAAVGAIAALVAKFEVDIERLDTEFDERDHRPR